MAETSTNLGRVSLVPRGAYDTAETYNRLDIVEYNGSSYLVLQDGTTGVAPEEGTSYMLVAGKGDTGATGSIGATGPQGIQGEKGDTGDIGPVGPKGDTGEQGQKGDVGETGPAGPKGDTGDTGNGIASIERTSGTGAAGTTDTYTITMTDGSTSTFQVYNGADGTGAGDMLKSVYDPQGKNTDVFNYVDNAVLGVEINVDTDPTEGSSNPVSSGGTFSALAAKQDKLIGTPGQVVGFNEDGAAAPVQRWSNQNLCDNGYFADPVNQRGQTSYSERDYIIDRWILGFSADATASFTIHPGEYSEWSGQGSWLIHRFPDTMLTGKMVTVSVLLYGGTLLSGSAIYNYVNDQNIIVEYFNIPGVMEAYAQSDETEGLWRVVLVNHSTTALKPVAAKFELGSVQTLAHKEGDTWVLNDPPPDKGMELLKCQRYFVRYLAKGYDLRIGYAFAYSQTNVSIQIPLPCSMRIVPAVSLSATAHIADQYSEYSITNLTVATFDKNLLTLDATTDLTTPMTIGRPALLHLSVGSYLDIDANL